MDASEGPDRCTATTTKGVRCRRPAVHASRGTAALCNVHAGLLRAGAGEGRQCTATTASGGRCPRWAVRGSMPARCSVHGERFAPAAEEARRCTAVKANGERCRQWAERESAARFGRALCPAHVRAAAGTPHWRAPGQEDSRRCTALTYAGSQCVRWAQPESEPPLCWRHRCPDEQPQIRHGLFRRRLPLSPVERAALAFVQATGEALDVAVVLTRLHAARLLAYLQQSKRPPEKDLNAIRLLMTALNQVRQLSAVRRELAPPEPWVVPREILAHLRAEGKLEEEPAATLAPDVAALVEEMLEDSLEGEIWVTRVALGRVFGLTTADLPVAELAPRARMVLRGTSLVQQLLLEEFVRQPRASNGPRRARTRGAAKGGGGRTRAAGAPALRPAGAAAMRAAGDSAADDPCGAGGSGAW